MCWVVGVDYAAQWDEEVCAVNCPRGHGALRWDGEDTTCIVCGYVHYTVEDQTKLRYQLWLDEIRSETGRRLRPAKPPGA